MPNITRRHLGGLAAGAALAGAAPRLSLAQGARPHLRIGAQGIPGNLEPIELIGNTGNRVSNALYDTIIKRDFFSKPDGTGTALVPGLATSWKRIDARTVELTLRENVKFHDGSVMTAEDVAFTLSEERIWGAKPLVPRAINFSPDFDAVVVTGPNTVRVATKTPNVAIEKFLASWLSWVVPKKHYLAVGPDGFATKPIGTGPFKLKELRSGDRIVLEAHDEYWGGRPTVETVTFQSVPEVSTRVAGLISGEFDIVTTLPTDALPQLARAGNVEGRGIVIENVHLITYQCDDAVLKDKRVRQALNMAIDRDLMVKALWSGLAQVPNGFQFPEYGEVYDSARPGFAFNPERARSLLQEAGYKGERVAFRTLPGWYANALPATQMAIEFWKKIGVNAEIEIKENWNQVLAPGMQVRNWSNGFQLPDPITPLTTDWGPKGNVQRGQKWAAPKEYNDLLPVIAGESDPVKRKAAFQRLIAIWEDEAPGTIYYRPYELYGVKKSINWKPVSFEFMDLRPYNLGFATP